MIGWLSSNPITEATEALDCVPLFYSRFYFISHVFGSWYFAAYLSVSSYSLSPSSPATAAVNLYPTSSSYSFSQHLLATHAPGILTFSSHRSRIGRVAMYCATVFCLFITYSPISLHPYSCIAVSSGGYYQLSSTFRFDCLPVILMDTMCWNPTRAWPMRGVINHLSDRKISTAFTTSFKNTPETLELASYLPSILFRWAQLLRAFRRFPTTANQLPGSRPIHHLFLHWVSFGWTKTFYVNCLNQFLFYIHI